MRTIAALTLTLTLTLTALGCDQQAAAAQPAPTPTVVADQGDTAGGMLPPALTWPYEPAAVLARWNATHRPANAITGAQSVAIAQWLNRIVLDRVIAYLDAVTIAYAVAYHQAHQSCTGGADCAAMIRSVFSARGLDGDAAVRVATCESTLNPRASNGSFGGLFQQMISAWSSRSATYGMVGRSIWDGYANAVVSAAMVAHDGGWGQWSCKP